MRYFLLVVLLAGLVLTAAGCSVKYKGVGIYPNSGEIFNCDIDHDLLMGQAQVTASNNAGVVCRGTSKVTYAPMLSICDGQRGIIDMTCSDGRRIVLDWEAESCTSGFGMGVDQSGRPVMIAFGGDEATLQSRALSLGGKAPAVEGNKESAGGGVQLSGVGTGFFITSDGFLVTNYHVVEGGTKFGFVNTVNGGDPVELKLVATDPANDIAVLKADTRSKPLPLAAKFNLKRGEEILTLGYPHPTVQGAEQKATFGRVNASTGYQDDIRFFQVDLPLQPGNSGGPLMNTKGEVTGIVTSIMVGEEYQNVNYALKIDYLYPMLAKELPGLKASPGAAGSMPQIVDRSERSVVMVLTFN